MTAATVASALGPLAWTVVLAVFESTLLAIVAAWWTRSRGASPAYREAVASGALLACIAAAALTFAALRWLPPDWIPGATPPVPARAGQRQQGQDAPAPRVAAAPAATLPALEPSAGRALLAAVATVWCVAAGALLLRLAGGLLLVRSLRARARRVDAPSVHEAAASLAERLGLARPIDCLQSCEIDAPAAVGWRRPAVLLPTGLHESTPPALLQPLLAHEIEHARRADAPKAALQGVADALLFHCPGARWLSREVRLAREESCDDAAVRACGGRERCAEALATLVGVRRGLPLVAASGQDGLSLSRRIRRILKGDDEMQPLTRSQVALLSALFVAVAGAGGALASTALADAAAVRAAGQAHVGKRPPSAYVWHQPGAPATITASSSDGRYVFQQTRVRNVSESRIAGLRFVAIIPDRRGKAPVRSVESALIATALDPGQASELRLDLLPIELLGTGAARLQPTLALVEARFADDDRWSVRLDARAVDAEGALYLEKASVAGTLVGAPAPAGSRDGVCLDHRGMPYSPGAVVPVLGSPTRFARCEKSAWRDDRLPPAPAPER